MVPLFLSALFIPRFDHNSELFSRSSFICCMTRLSDALASYCSWSIGGTVAVWTQKKIFPLLIRPQGSQGCQKITFFFLQMKMFSFCAKIAPKRHKLQKPSKLKKKCQKNPVFLDFFKYSSIWGQS